MEYDLIKLNRRCISCEIGKALFPATLHIDAVIRTGSVSVPIRGACGTKLY